MEGHNDVELRVVHNWAHRRDVDALTVAHFALTPLIVDQISADGHKLRLKEVAQLAAELGPPLGEVERLWQVDAVWDVEAERD